MCGSLKNSSGSGLEVECPNASPLTLLFINGLQGKSEPQGLKRHLCCISTARLKAVPFPNPIQRYGPKFFFRSYDLQTYSLSARRIAL